MTDFVVITGMSGAGRSTVAGVLEDRGWFVIDNLPTSLMGKVVELASAPGSTIDQVALAIGPGALFEDPSAFLGPLRAAGEGTVRVVFLDASTDVLVRRYESTKRRHPVGGDSLASSIERERRLADGLRMHADLVIDTTELSVHDLRHRIEELVGAGLPGGMTVSVTSFGYKHGLPADADLVFDCRFLPNPHWVDALRPRTGRDPEVRAHALDHPLAGTFLDHVTEMLTLLLPEYEAEGKAYLSIAFGCTGGHHRSVAVAEEIAARLRATGVEPTVSHRDVDK
ncbi:MAG TPA: RNase adapter RapZ [Acidimicrobiales bacterium]|nr:RNase adapter RapZ [Acidimicrobiales bacterium]